MGTPEEGKHVAGQSGKALASPPVEVMLLESFLPYRLNSLAVRVSAALSTLYVERFGIAVAEWRVLATIAQYRRVTASEVCFHANMHKTRVSRAVTALIDREYISRIPNPEDKRQMIMEMRPAGWDVYGAILPCARDFADRLGSALSDSELRGLDAAIDALHARLDQIEAEGIVT